MYMLWLCLYINFCYLLIHVIVTNKQQTNKQQNNNNNKKSNLDDNGKAIAFSIVVVCFR